MQKDAKRSASAQSGSGSLNSAARRRYRLRKSTTLRGYRSFTDILSGGHSVSAPPLRLFYRDRPAPAQTHAVGFAVSRSFRSAAKRNRVRRLMREAFRYNLQEWMADHHGRRIEAVWMYVGSPSQTPRLNDIEKAMKTIIQKVSARVS